jgi:hypothetical protein
VRLSSRDFENGEDRRGHSPDLKRKSNVGETANIRFGNLLSGSVRDPAKFRRER